jgi:hypothetical protein
MAAQGTSPWQDLHWNLSDAAHKTTHTFCMETIQHDREMTRRV